MATWDVTPFYRTDNGESRPSHHLIVDYTETYTDGTYTLKVNSVTYNCVGGLGDSFRLGTDGAIEDANGKFRATWGYESTIAKGATSYRWTVNKSYSINRTQATQSNAVAIGITVGLQKSGMDYIVGRGITGAIPKKWFSVLPKPSYKVTYNANGGSSTPSAQTKWYGENLTLRGSISRANSTVTTYTVTLRGNGISDPAALKAAKTRKYTFAGWNTNSGGTGTNYSASGTYSANAAATLYAKWTSSDSTAQVTFPSPTRSGYTFGGWGTTNTATTAAYAGGAKLTPTQNVTYHAIWKRTITYNGNVPSGVSVTNLPAAATSVASSDTTISGNTPTRTGYVFKGWATTAAAKVAEYQPSATYAANKPNVTLYAVWESTVTLGKLTSVRCNSSGTPTDDGDCALLTLPWTLDSSTGGSATVNFSITANQGSSPSYGPITVSNYSGTISELIPGFSTEVQYAIAVTVTENVQSGTGGSATARDILSRAYFTMDVLGDAYYDYETHTGPRPGHGIAFGMPAKEEGMHVGYPITLGNGDNEEASIRYHGPKSYQKMIRFLPNNNDIYGNGIVIGAGSFSNTTDEKDEVGGTVVIGSGESAGKLVDALSINPSYETTYISSDGAIEFYTNCNNIANRRKMVMSDTSFNMYSSVNKTGTTASSMTSDPVIHLRGTDGTTIGQWVARFQTDGREGTQIEAFGHGVWNGIGLYVDANGNRSVLLSEAAPWRKALGIGVNVDTNGSNVSVATGNTFVRLATISLGAGIWLVQVGGYCAGNTTGIREIVFTAQSSAASVGASRINTVRWVPTGWDNYMSVHSWVYPSDTTTYYVYGRQTSGSSLNMNAYIRAIRLQ